MSDGLNDARKGFASYIKGRQDKKEDVPTKDYPLGPTFIFKVKLDKYALNDPKLVTDPNGFIYVITTKPSTIYDIFETEAVLSVEKISNAYIPK